MVNAEKDKYLKVFGARISEMRQNKGLSQSQLSDLTELDVMTISRIERGLLNISIINSYKIALALEVSQKELFDFNL